MNKVKINELYEKAYVTYEVPYNSSVVDPTIVSVHQQKVWDRYLFAELIVAECANRLAEDFIPEDEIIEGYNDTWDSALRFGAQAIKEHFGVEE